MYLPSKTEFLVPCKPFSAEPDDAGRVLLEAAHLIRTHGLTKFRREDEDGLCLHGALAKAQFGTSHFEYRPAEMDEPAYDRLLSHMVDRRIVPPGKHGLADWNNAPERTAAEVIAALEGAAFFVEV